MSAIKCILAEQAGSGGTDGGTGIYVQELELVTPPTKTAYIAGDMFDRTGMQVIGKYGINGVVIDSLTADITANVTITPNPLVDGTTEIKISSLGEGGKEISVTYPVTVTHRLVSINPIVPEQEFEYGDSFPSTIAAIADYSDGDSQSITASCSPTALNSVGPQTITASYTENGVTCTNSITIEVKRKSVAKPTWKGITLTYNTNQQNVNSETYWNNYNTTYWIISNYTGTNAGTYTTKFTLNDNYRWEDGGIDELEVDWVINKAAGSLTVNPATVNLDANNLIKNVTITRSGTGIISYSPESITGLTLTLSDNILTIQSDGATELDTSLTISVESDNNYKAPANQTINIKFASWSWGSETEDADADWWSGLKEWIGQASTAELQSCIGKTKSVTLNTSVLDTTTHLVRCIGYNCNRDKNNINKNTLTFETANILNSLITFGISSGTKWTASNARQQCINYYNAFPGKASICTVSIGTAVTMNEFQNSTPIYTDETVFLASDAEHGFSKGHDQYNGKGFALSYDEFDQYNASKTPYQYCSSNANRIKKKGDNGTAQYYWERSYPYNSGNGGCLVNDNGQPTYNGNANSYGAGLAPAFVI